MLGQSAGKTPSVWKRVYAILQIVVVLLMAPLSTGCVSGGGSAVKGFAKEPVYGRFAGKDWKYRHAYFDPTAETPGEEDYLLVLLPFKPKEACPKDGFSSSAKVIMTSIPIRKKATKLKRRGKRTLTFSTVQKGRPKFKQAKKGKVELTKLGKEQVEGRIFGILDDDNWVSGRFKAVRCSFSDMETAETPW